MEVCLVDVIVLYIYSCFDYYRKCIRMGMKKDGKCMILLLLVHYSFRFFLAVQKERDRLGGQRGNICPYKMAPIKSRRHITDDFDEDEDDLSVMALLKAEQTAKEVREEIEYLILYE